MRYATPDNWAKYFKEIEGVQICGETIRKKLQQAEKVGRMGRNKIGKALINAFYSESDVREVCSYLLEHLSIADEKGFFEVAGIKYGAVKSWSENLMLNEQLIYKKIRDAGKNGIKGKDKSGHVIIFFSEPDVREVCSEFLNIQKEGRLDANKILIIDGIKYATIKVWSDVFQISEPTLFRRLTNFNIKRRLCKNLDSQIKFLFSEADVIKVCSDIIEKMPRTNENDFFDIDNMKYRTIYGWADVLKISEPYIKLRIRITKTEGIKGKDQNGHICDFYPESTIRQVCAQLLQPISQADESGFFEKDGQRYGYLRALMERFGISQEAISKRIRSHNIQAVKAKDKGGRVFGFYPESIVRDICSDILQPLPEADENGILEKDNEKFRTVHSLSKSLGISHKAIKSRVKIYTPKSLKGKMKGGQIYNFYSESDIHRICSDLLLARQSKSEGGAKQKNS